MRSGALAKTPVQFAGIGLGVLDQLPYRVCRQPGPYNKNPSDACNPRHRNEVFGRVATNDLGRERVTDCPAQQCMAVRRSAGEFADTDRAAAAGTILDNDGLSQAVRQVVRHQPRRHVDRRP